MSRITKALALGGALAFAATGCTTDQLDADQQEQQLSGDSRYVVKYNPGHGPSAQAAARGLGGDVVLELTQQRAFAAYLPAAAVTALAHNPAVDFIEVDVRRKPLAQVTPWGITAVNADQAYSSASAGPIKVCIIDSGFDGLHEDRWSNVSGTNVNRTKRYGLGGGTLAWDVDDCGHGTHVAGTIAAENNALGVVGVAPFAPGNVSLHIIRVFEGADCGWTYASDLVGALNECEKAGANIINMSLGGGSPSSVEQAAFDAALANGILPIAAAGNEQEDTPGAYSYPASYASVMSVAATDINGNVATFSNQNDAVDIAAPGVHVNSTVPRGMGSEVSLSTGHEAASMDGSANGTATGYLVDCGLGATACPSGGYADFVCLIQRGDYPFYQKANNCAAGGGKGVIIYNNAIDADEILYGTYDGAASLLGVGVSRASGEDLLATSLGTEVTLSIVATNYSFYNGTSMATPHVAGVAALVWSHNPACSADDVRTALTSTAARTGDDWPNPNKFGAGLVQADVAAAALMSLDCAAGPAPECTVDADCAMGEVCNSGTCEPDSSGGGPGTCSDDTGRPTGCSCTADSQCYFGKCKGRRDSKTCN